MKHTYRCSNCDSKLLANKCGVCGEDSHDYWYRKVEKVSDTGAEHMELKKRAVDILIDVFGFHGSNIEMEYDVPLMGGVVDVFGKAGIKDSIGIECVNRSKITNVRNNVGNSSLREMDIDILYLRNDGLYTIIGEKIVKIDLEEIRERDQYEWRQK